MIKRLKCQIDATLSGGNMMGVRWYWIDAASRSVLQMAEEAQCYRQVAHSSIVELVSCMDEELNTNMYDYLEQYACVSTLRMLCASLKCRTFRYSLVIRTCGLHPQGPSSTPGGGTFDDRWCDAPVEVSLGRVIM